MSRTYSNIINRDVQKNPLNKKFQTRQYLLKNEKKYLFKIQVAEYLIKIPFPLKIVLLKNHFKMILTHQLHVDDLQFNS